uniref:Annexin n=1 Tax=Hucho hucho TaxID=62062 RepID=A0A4W5K300_9TELE
MLACFRSLKHWPVLVVVIDTIPNPLRCRSILLYSQPALLDLSAGTNEKTLIDVLTQRSSGQRQLICKAYQEEATGKTLVEDLEGDTHGHFEDLLVALATPPAIYDSQEVTKALKGVGTKDSVLIEIFATRSNKQIKEISDAYLKQTERKLTLDLKNEISGEFAKAILILAEGKRDENTHVDAAKAKEDAKVL